MSLYPSTKGLSVYNVLSLARRDLSPAEVLASLQLNMDSSIDEAWVAEGVSFLTERGFIGELGGKLVPARPRAPDGTAWPLQRAKHDTDLRWAS